MKEFWNERYREQGYAYGDEPNQFLEEILSRYAIAGKAFFAAEGEGRNAVFAARMGLEVCAGDFSEAGQSKALQLAQEKGVTIDYQICDLTLEDPKNGPFDLIVLIFAHFPPAVRKAIHLRLIAHLKPGGYLILEGFSKKNLIRRSINPKIGGPDRLDLLFSAEEIADDMQGLQPVLLNDTTTELNEGKYHVGTAEVVRYVGIKT